MAITVEERSARTEEVMLLERQWLPPSVYALLMALVALVMYFMLALGVLMVVAAIFSGPRWERLNAAIQSTIESAPWVEPVFVFVLWGPVFIVPLWIAWGRFNRLRRERLEAWRDRRDARVEVIWIEDEPFFELMDKRGCPYVIFDLDRGKSLLVSKYTFYHHICSERACEALDGIDHEPNDAEVDAVYAEYMPLFPARRIELHRWPGTGNVLYLAGEGGVSGHAVERHRSHEKFVAQLSGTPLRDSVILPS